MEVGVGEPRGRPDMVHAARTYLGTFARLSPNARRLLLATVGIYTSLGVFGVLFNLYLVALGHTLAFVGLVAAVTTVGQAAISPPVGWAMRRIGARRTMAAGTLLLAVSLTLSALIVDATGLAIAAALSGVALSVATIPANPYMMEHAAAHERSHLFSAYFAASTVGGMLGSLCSGVLPLLGAAIFAAHGGGEAVAYRFSLIAGAALSLASVWLLWAIRDEAPSADSLDRPAALVEEDGGESRLRRDVLIMLAATSGVALAMGATMPFFNVYFSTRLHAGAATIGTIYALSGVVCTVAAFLAPVAGRRGRLPAFSAARVLTGPVFVLFWLHPILPLAACAYTARNVLGTISGALENAFAMEVLPARLRGTVAGWRSFGFNGAWSLGSLLSGLVVAQLGYDVVFVAGGVITALAASGYFVRFAGRGVRR